MVLFGNVQDSKAITCFVTPTITTFRQLDLWDSDYAQYQFVPTAQYGYVVFVSGNVPAKDTLLYAFAVKRPRALELKWPSRVNVFMSKFTLAYGDKLFNGAKNRFKVIK